MKYYVVDSTKKATRLELINTDATALATDVYPSIYIDLMKTGFEEWSKSDDLNGITKQTM